MKHIINLWQSFHFCGYGNPKHYAIGASLGAIVSGIGGIVGSAMNTNSQYSTNAKNVALTREGWRIQREEAEKAREFNSEEAEKAREYYSEQAVMERRKEAGLNTALSGSDSASSGASASGSAGSISSPIPMQTPQVGAIGSALSEAIGNYFGFKQAEIQGSKISAETSKILQDIVHDKAMHEVSIRMNTQILENLKQTTEELSLKNIELRNSVRLERLHVNEVYNRFYNDWVTIEMAKDNVKIDGGKFVLMYEKDRAKIIADAKNFASELRLKKTDLEYKYGGRARVGSTYDQNTSNINGSAWSIHGKYHAGASANGGFPGVAKVGVNSGIELDGNYTSSQQSSTAEMVGISSLAEHTFSNSDIGKILSEVEGALIVLESPDSSDEVIRNAIDVILRANYSFEAFIMYYEKLDRFARQQTPGLETLQ